MGSLHHLHRQVAAPRDANDLRGLNEAAAQAAAHAHIFRIPSARETDEAVTTPAASSVTYDPLGDEQPDAIHWPSFFAGIILGLAGGLLAIALPAIVLARILYGVWF